MITLLLAFGCPSSDDPDPPVTDDTPAATGDTSQEPTGTSGTTGDTATTSTPTGETGSPGGTWQKLSAGNDLTCGIDQDAEIRCQGSTMWSIPVPPPGPFVDVAASWDTVCGVRPTGELVCFGCTWVSDLCLTPAGTDWVAVDAADDSICAQDSVGEVECWNYAGTMDGPISGQAYDDFAVGITGFAGVRSKSGIVDVAPEGADADQPLKSVAAGRSALCGLAQSDDSTQCWFLERPDPPAAGLADLDGYGAAFCWLTTAGLVDCHTPLTPDAARDGFDPATEVFDQVVAGHTHACGVTPDGRGFCWPRDGRPETSGIPERP